MTKTEKPQTIESLKFSVKINNYKWALVLTAITMLVAGVILGYFLSINLITSAQHEVVNSIVLKAQ